jgi:hypothetical protein
LGSKLTQFFKCFNDLITTLVVEHNLDIISPKKFLVSFSATSALAESNKDKWEISTAENLTILSGRDFYNVC